MPDSINASSLSLNSPSLRINVFEVWPVHTSVHPRVERSCLGRPGPDILITKLPRVNTESAVIQLEAGSGRWRHWQLVRGPRRRKLIIAADRVVGVRPVIP